MGRAVCMSADMAVVTTDNPRTENAGAIIDGILEGTKGSRTPVYIQPDRKKAIEFALKKAEKDDIVLLAGKGHERFQLVGDDKIPFDEREEIKRILKN